MKKTKEKRGITLIALIITIIVLLILAGVTISMVVGDNGVLTQAQNAKIKTEKAKDEELRGLTAAEAGGNLEMTWYQDTVPIPAGFAVSQVEGENKVDDGLVVIDKNGNEFVWIPCGTKTGETYNTKEYEDAKDYVKNKWSDKTDENYNNKTWTNTDSSGKDNTGTEENEETIDNGKITAKDSIAKYGGFYVARFEAGVPSDADFYVSTNGSSNGEEYKGKNGTSGTSPDENGFTSTEYDRKDENLKPVSKRYNQVWNYIDQITAKKVSEKMYEYNDDVDSYLIDSNAWNYICGDIFVKELGENGIKDSTQYGNYLNNTTTDYTSLDCLWAKHKYNKGSGFKYATRYGKGSITAEVIDGRDSGNRIELATGASDDFKVYNIYDMAGNVWEWTEGIAPMNGYSSGSRRGGGNGDIGSDYPVFYARGNSTVESSSVNIGFRPVLYVK